MKRRIKTGAIARPASPARIAEQLQTLIASVSLLENNYGRLLLKANAQATDDKARNKLLSLSGATSLEKPIEDAHREINKLAAIAKRRGDLRARALVVLYEMLPAEYASKKLRFSELDDGGATRALFDCVTTQCGLAPFVAMIEGDLEKGGER
jgi:hypothetical protein